MRTADPKAMRLMKNPTQSSADLFSLKANLAVVVRGPMGELPVFAERIESLCVELGLIVVHKQASASKLWIKEGEPGE